MNFTFDFDDSNALKAKLKVVGVGGAGCNAINRMIAEGLRGVEFIGINTDEQALNVCKAPLKVYIGTKTTHGLGAGADPEKGRRAVEEDRNAVYDSLSDADMVFITAGMGGGTGTGASPTVAEIAKDIDALTVGIVTTPFMFEGPKRMQRAEEGIAALKECVDTLIVIPNQRLLTIVPPNTPLDAGFRFADEILFNATKGISDLITITGLVNLDFADVRAVMSEMGDALMGCGAASGEDRAQVAARQAINSPLLEDVSISGALGVLVNITGGTNLSLHEVNEAASIISEEAGPKANLIFGSVIDKSLEDEIRITVIATGLSTNKNKLRYSGLNRQRYMVAGSGKINKREVPAIDRVEEINQELSENANIDISSFKSGKVKKTFNNLPEIIEEHKEKIKLEQNREIEKQERDSIDNKEDDKERKESFIYKNNSNGFGHRDLDEPACRRKKWNMFGLD
ncbi:cell division protein FtsZ [candidate division KSB1 bacterium]|nr:cell division protein FtsZ [candidate division KSB1 bacterium]